MKHFRILEIKGKNKYYIIQYIKKNFIGLYSWKKLNNEKYNNYDEALTQVKNSIIQSDYSTSTIGYHYIDAYKLFKQKNKEINN